MTLIDKYEENPRPRQYPRLAVDGVVIDDGRVVLITRKCNPFKGYLALPGGFVETGESCERAVVREVREETGIRTKVVKLIGVWSKPNRDPRRTTRGQIVAVAYLLQWTGGKLRPGDDAAVVYLVDVDKIPKLAFDHNEIVREGLELVWRK